MSLCVLPYNHIIEDIRTFLVASEATFSYLTSAAKQALVERKQRLIYLEDIIYTF